MVPWPQHSHREDAATVRVWVAGWVGSCWKPTRESCTPFTAGRDGRQRAGCSGRPGDRPSLLGGSGVTGGGSGHEGSEGTRRLCGRRPCQQTAPSRPAGRSLSGQQPLTPHGLEDGGVLASEAQQGRLLKDPARMPQLCHARLLSSTGRHPAGKSRADREVAGGARCAAGRPPGRHAPQPAPVLVTPATLCCSFPTCPR